MLSSQLPREDLLAATILAARLLIAAFSVNYNRARLYDIHCPLISPCMVKIKSNFALLYPAATIYKEQRFLYDRVN